MQPTLDQRIQELSPMNFGLRQRYTDLHYGATTIRQHANGYQNSTVSNDSIGSNTLVASIQEQVGNLA